MTDAGAAPTPALAIARRFAPAGTRVDEVLELAFDQRERSRLRATLLSGEEVGIDLPVGTLLADGARLQLEDGRIVAVEAAEEALLAITADAAPTLLRIAYHIGNRHVPIEIAADALYILPDHVLRALAERLGGRIAEVARRFQPESGAYGHGHVHHHHDDAGHGGRIHDMSAR
ncbi:MAG: urease accessory protein UreE [Lautropia sp.]